jgi:hypothetical protein
LLPAGKHSLTFTTFTFAWEPYRQQTPHRRPLYRAGFDDLKVFDNLILLRHVSLYTNLSTNGSVIVVTISLEQDRAHKLLIGL